MSSVAVGEDPGRAATRSSIAAARRDLLAGSVVIIAILLLCTIGGLLFPVTLRRVTGTGYGVELLLVVALLLNIGLFLFGWRRYRELARASDQCAAAEARAEGLAHSDPLTGFRNRASLAETGAAMLARGARQDQATALLMFDLDQFKTVNDVHGHAVGDALLKRVAEEVQALIPTASLAARFGGDEFACCFLFDPDETAGVDLIAEKIVLRLARPFDIDGIGVHIGCSLGIACSDNDSDTIEALMRRADIAMHVAKNDGRNRYCWFDTSMEHELQLRNRIEADMRAGIPRGEFVPYYEQQIDLTTGNLLGFEVLARWEHPTDGVILPQLFIPIAEETGMIGALSMTVIRRALEEARDWDPSLTLSVNVAPSQLKDPWLAQKLIRLLIETGFPPTRLEIEITESSLFENLGLAQSIIGSLKTHGIRLALDDFGTGYSSLAHLRALPFDRIKIDRSFVASINDNSESAAIVNAIARLGESLGLPVTAEGIEDAGIEERLRTLGLYKGQGWHFGKPLPVAQVRKLLAEKNMLPSGRTSSGPYQDRIAG